MILIQTTQHKPSKIPVVCIIVPHPDDFEIFACHAAQYFITEGYKVIEILMTGGEYGIVNRFRENGERLKGLPLRKIRFRENTKAKEAYDRVLIPTDKDYLQKPYVSNISMGYVDGYLPVTPESLEDLLHTLNELQPDVVVGAEPVYSIDWHRDHMATAYLTYFAIKRLISGDSKYIPKKYYLYQGFNPNRSFPLQSWEIFQQACIAHRSQLSPLSVRRMAAIVSFYRKLLSRNCFKMREISTKDIHSFIKTSRIPRSIKNRLLFGIFHKTGTKNPLYYPTPEELGFSRIPERLHTKER